jgi:hypothetical protein
MKPTGETRSTRGKTCPSAPSPTTNPTLTAPGSNPGFRGEGPAPIGPIFKVHNLLRLLDPWGWNRQVVPKRL